MYHQINNKTELAINCGGNQLIGKECIVESFSVNQKQDMSITTGIGRNNSTLVEGPKAPVEITVTFICPADKFNMKRRDEDYQPRIRNKNVESCSIQELLYAVRQKIKEADNGTIG